MVMGSLPEEVDLAVIGGGVGGYIAAIRAAQLGLSVAIVEKHKMGGHCLNYACIPSKTMIYYSDLYHRALNAKDKGVILSGQLDAGALYRWRMAVSEKLEKGVEFLCRKNKVEVIKGEATFLSSSTIQLTNGTSLDFKKAIIATGSVPKALDGLPFNGKSIIDYKTALMLEHPPETMTIVGGGYVAVEIGTIYAKMGKKVRIIARSGILSHFDKDASEIVSARMKELGIEVYASMPVAFSGNQVQLDDGTKMDSGVMLVAIGLEPYTVGLGLENTKVSRDKRGFIKVNNRLETEDRNIMALGDVVGEPMLAHKAMRQGVVAGEVAAGLDSEFDNAVIPSVVFSDPEIASAGEIDSNGLESAKFPLSALGKAIAIDETKGFVKIFYNKDKLVKGIEIVSQDAGNMISEAAEVIEMGGTLEDIADTIHPHPTMSEAYMEAAEEALGRPIHFFTGD